MISRCGLSGNYIYVYLRVSFGMNNCNRMSNQPARDSPFIVNNRNVNSICMYTHIHLFCTRHFNKIGDPDRQQGRN